MDVLVALLQEFITQSYTKKIKMETNKFKSGEEITRCLSEPKELCKTCYNWLTQEDVGFNDLPQCSEDHCSDARKYLFGRSDTCKRYCNM